MAVGTTLGRHGQIGHGRHGDATGGHGAVELHQGVADAAPGHHPFEGGRLDDAVPQGERAQIRRGEDLGGLAGASGAAVG